MSLLKFRKVDFLDWANNPKNYLEQNTKYIVIANNNTSLDNKKYYGSFEIIEGIVVSSNLYKEKEKQTLSVIGANLNDRDTKDFLISAEESGDAIIFFDGLVSNINGNHHPEDKAKTKNFATDGVLELKIFKGPNSFQAQLKVLKEKVFAQQQTEVAYLLTKNDPINFL